MSSEMTENLEALPERVDRIEQKLDRVLELLTPPPRRPGRKKR